MNVNELRDMLVDEKLGLWQRYRAMFALRNIGDDEAVKALACGLSCEDSALFRHEIAYVLGQLQCDAAFEELKTRLEMRNEHPMVRHECAEALGSIGSEEARQLLQLFTDADEERVVKESCEVALDMVDYEREGGLLFDNALISR